MSDKPVAKVFFVTKGDVRQGVQVLDWSGLTVGLCINF